jgi:exodeoxyribonuclease V beta subunit
VRFQVASFSTLVHPDGDVPVPALEGLDHDPFVAPNSAIETVPGRADVWFGDLQSGARTGEWLHALLEQLDFTQPIADQAERLEKALQAQNVPLSLEALAKALQAIVDTPLVAGWSLSDIPSERRRSELGFVLPAGLRCNGEGGGLTRAHLAQVFARYATSPTVREYANEVAKLPFGRWRGFLKGYLDLVFEHEGRWYVADYKSNDLGPRSADYEPARLARAMVAHHYVLQYHLYVLAVHRWLQATLPGYDYERHFGGVLYLFLRGMRPEHPRGTGVFFDRPPARLVEALERYFTDGRCPA